MSLPKEYRKLIVQKISTDFREAVQIVTVPLEKPSNGQALVKIRYVGANATDVNTTAGRRAGCHKPPFDIGLEAIGEVVLIGGGVTKVKVGDSVAFLDQGSYTEYQVVPAEKLMKIPECKPEYVALLVSGLSAALSLEKQGRVKPGETVLVTAAAGGLGHILIQLAKEIGCHVIGLCSTKEKEEFIKSLGCDRIINYKKENVGEVLQREYPKGIDVILETVGGELYKTLVQNLAVRGRLVIIGFITGYKDAKGQLEVDIPQLPKMLLGKSASISGFMRTAYPEFFEEYLQKLVQKNLKVKLDTGNNGQTGELNGLEGIIDGVEYLHSGKSFGKVVVQIS